MSIILKYTGGINTGIDIIVINLDQFLAVSASTTYFMLFHFIGIYACLIAIANVKQGPSYTISMATYRQLLAVEILVVSSSLIMR